MELMPDPAWVARWCVEQSAVLDVLTCTFEATHGYPPGENAVRPRTPDSSEATGLLVELSPIPSDLATLYGAVSELSLPDVHSGWFVHSPDLVLAHCREYGLAVIEGEYPAVVFASDGAGHLYAVGGSGRVWCSRRPASWEAFDLAESSVQEFLDRIGRDIAAQAGSGAMPPG